MFLRVFVLFLGVVGGTAAGWMGVKWLASASEHSSTIESKRNDSDETVKQQVERIDNMSKAAYLLLAALPLGIAGGVLAGLGKGKLAALLLILAAPGPVVFSFTSIIATFGLLFGGLLALLIQAPVNPSDKGLKGCWNAVKGWLNIGGVKVQFEGVSPNVPKHGTAIAGKVVLKTRTDRHVTGVHYKLMMKRSKGKGEDKETKEKVLGQTSQALARDLHAGESLTLDFRLPYAFERDFKDMGGVVGGIGKLAAFAMSEKDEFFLIAEAEVPGAIFEPSAKLKVKMVD